MQGFVAWAIAGIALKFDFGVNWLLLAIPKILDALNSSLKFVKNALWFVVPLLLSSFFIWTSTVNFAYLYIANYPFIAMLLLYIKSLPLGNLFLTIVLICAVVCILLLPIPWQRKLFCTIFSYTRMQIHPCSAFMLQSFPWNSSVLDRVLTHS